MNRPHTIEVLAKADEIGRRLLAGERVAALMREYRVAWPTIDKIYAAAATPEQRAAQTHAKQFGAGRRSRFKRGSEPWNKNLKGIHPSPATEWQPGCLRGQAARKYRGIGTVTIRRDSRGRKYKWIKLSDDGPPKRRYIPLAQYVYERREGKLPPGHFVVHINGDTLDDVPDNLVAVTRQTVIRFQHAHVSGFTEKRRTAASRAATTRHAINRMKRSGTIVAWECPSCSHTITGPEPDRCPRCGSLRLIRIRMPAFCKEAAA